MHITKEFDTIVAISTPPGEGAITIIRLSGDNAVEIAEKISHYKKKKLTEVPSHTIHYGHIKDPKTNEVIDEVMFTVMLAPKTFTRENIVEINCHGGMVVANQILQLILRYGGRLAEPGEFTKRAFLNGRLDLSQAEAVMDLIKSKTDNALKLALNQLEGKLSTLIKKLREEILQALAQVEVNIDYPEYDDVEMMTLELLKEKATNVKLSINHILSTAKQGKILREGLSTAIIGRPNVGKSSLLNYLLQEEKAIVTDIAGTTRDVIEEYVNIKGIPLKLIDTAGIRETEDIVEKIGVDRSKKVLKEADLILLMLNQSEPLTKVDIKLLNMTKNIQRIILLNKSDLNAKVTLSNLQPYIGGDVVLMTSITTSDGIDKLEQAIKELFFINESNDKDASYVSNARHISLLEQSNEALDDVLNGIELGVPVDLLQIDMTRSWELLGEIIGDNIQDELITQLFSQFCLGK